MRIGDLGRIAANRLDALLDDVEASVDAHQAQPGAFRGWVLKQLQRDHGIRPQWANYSLRQQYGWLSELQRPMLLATVSAVLRGVHRPTTKSGIMTRPTFEGRLNEILAQGGCGFGMHDAQWKPARETEADDLLRVLLEDSANDVANCKQGDVQQEMVASSVQGRLSQPGSLIVDYGAGLGRVGEGLSTASLFAGAKYVAVDSPVTPMLRDVLERLGGQTDAMEREAFLSCELVADVILVVNTLHHIPFADLARDFARLLRRLSPGGELIVHEMGELPKPEQRNVPWLTPDVESLFAGIDAIVVNARSTQTRGKRLPLAHVLLTLRGDLPQDLELRLTANVAHVWRGMKKRCLDLISSLYDAADPDPEKLLSLRSALIHNANLDLNAPNSM